MMKMSTSTHTGASRMTLSAFLICGVLAFAMPATPPAEAQTRNIATLSLPAPTVQPAIDGIFAAFKTHLVVGISDNHGLAQEEDFYAALVSDPRFAREVGNVVVEFGSSAHQNTIDRYLAGENVPYAELRKVWTDVVGWVPTVTQIGYINFFARVRTANLVLPPEQRIRIWLGDPPVDWAKINSPADVLPFLSQRDSYPARIIRQEILAKDKKALVIYGGAHYGRVTPAVRERMEEIAKTRGVPISDLLGIQGAVEDQHPHGFFTVAPYSGYVEKPCSLHFEESIKDWPQPALVTPVRGSSLESKLRQIDCHFLAPGAVMPSPTMTNAQQDQMLVSMEDTASGITSDALLYLGPAAGLTNSPTAPDIYLDLDYRQEIMRRQMGMMNEGALTAETSYAAPHYKRP